MEIADLFANMGGQDLTPEEKKRAIKWGLLNMGAGMLANNRGNYGDFSPALGAGLSQGLLGYQAQLGREEAGAASRAKKEAQQKLFQSAVRPSIPGIAPQPEVPTQYKVGDLNFNSPQEAEQYILGQGTDKQGLGAAMYNEMGGTKQLPQGTDFSQYTMPPYMPLTLDPKMQVNTIPGKPGVPGVPEQQGGFDKQAFMMNALKMPEAGYSDAALKALLENNSGVEPKLVTVYENGVPVQKWVRPGESSGVSIGLGKPEDDPAKTALIQMMREGNIDPKSTRGQKIINDWITKQTTHAPAPSANASIGKIDNYIPASEAAQAEFMKGARTTYDSLKSAPVMIANIEKAKALVPEARMFTGSLGNQKLAAVKLMRTLGMPIATSNVQSAEELRTRMFYTIMENLKKMDAQPSEMQQTMMMEALGNLGTDPSSIASVLDIMGESLRGKVQIHNMEMQGAIKNGVKFPYNPVINLPEAQTNKQGKPSVTNW
jgi:hypothetical protein